VVGLSVMTALGARMARCAGLAGLGCGRGPKTRPGTIPFIVFIIS
jgi:hypothetical protein